MIKTSTQNELIQYAYNELADDAREQLEVALTHDDELAEGCSDFLLIQHLLDKAMRAPSDRAINNILNYSKSLSLQS
jgi:anti-sigma factor RsiW